MDFDLTDVQRAWRRKAQELGRSLAEDAIAADVVSGAARAGLLNTQGDLVAAAIAVEALACATAGAGMALALHIASMLALNGRGPDAARRGEIVCALSLSTEEVPAIDNATAGGGTLTGRASWVGPITARGVAIVGARQGAAEITACSVSLEAPGVGIEPLDTSGLRGFASAHVTFDGTPYVAAGEPARIMTVARTLIAATALGIGGRALQESLAVAHHERGAGGEQTVEGLLADAATELDAARLLTWKAAAGAREAASSLADASMAKLAASGAAQAAVIRATQVVGVNSFRRGHVIERLTQDVRAIELFAGRTEALRESVAEARLPRST